MSILCVFSRLILMTNQNKFCGKFMNKQTIRVCFAIPKTTKKTLDVAHTDFMRVSHSKWILKTLIKF